MLSWTSLDVRQWATDGQALAGELSLHDMARLQDELPAGRRAGASSGVSPTVRWQATAQWRAASEASAATAAAGPTTKGAKTMAAWPAGQQLWLMLALQAEVPQICQRCLASYAHTIDSQRWFRFVATEAQAVAEDDTSEEDLLAWTPQFNLAELIEEELILELPLVPMHEECPEPLIAGTAEVAAMADERPHPFAALARLRVPKEGA